MSNQLYPELPGLTWPVMRTPQWKTSIQTTPSLREFRTSSVLNPVHELTLKYEFLRQRSSQAEYQRLFDFYANHRGDFDTFLFLDPSDYQASQVRLAVGTGTVSQYQTARWIPNTPFNLAPWSDQMFMSGWNPFGATVVGNAAAAYDGLPYAIKLKETTVNGVHGLNMSAGLFSPDVNNLWAVDVKADGRSVVQLVLYNGVAAPQAYCGANFDLVTNAVQGFSTSSGSLLTAAMLPLGNGWFRCYVIGTAGVVSDGLQFAQVVLSNGSGVSYAGDGNSGLLLARAMLMPSNDLKPYVRNPSASPLFPKLEPVYAPYGAQQFYTWTASTGFSSISPSTVSLSGLATFASPIPAGVSLYYTGTYYWRCRFADGSLSLEQFMRQFWQAGRVKLRTVKP